MIINNHVWLWITVIQRVRLLIVIFMFGNSDNIPPFLALSFFVYKMQNENDSIHLSKHSEESLHYRQLQWTSMHCFWIFKFKVSNSKKRNVTEQYSVEKVRYRVEIILFMSSLYIEKTKTALMRCFALKGRFLLLTQIEFDVIRILTSQETVKTVS